MSLLLAIFLSCLELREHGNLMVALKCVKYSKIFFPGQIEKQIWTGWYIITFQNMQKKKKLSELAL